MFLDETSAAVWLWFAHKTKGHSLSLMAVIGLLELKSLATTRSFARGEAYFKDAVCMDLR